MLQQGKGISPCEAQGFLLAQPFVEVTGRAATGDDLEAFLVKALADRGTDTAHATCDATPNPIVGGR
eukprot:gene8463-10043_t